MGRLRFTPSKPCCSCCPPGTPAAECCPCDCQGYCYTADGQDTPIYLPFAGQCTWQGSGTTIQYCRCIRKWKVWRGGATTPALYDFVDCATAPGGSWYCAGGDPCAALLAPYAAGAASIAVKITGWTIGPYGFPVSFPEKSTDGCIDCSPLDQTFSAAYRNPLPGSQGNTCQPFLYNASGYQFGACLSTSAAAFTGAPCGPPYGYYSLGVGVACSATYPSGPCGAPEISLSITISDIPAGGPNLVSQTFEIGDADTIAGTYIWTNDYGLIIGPCQSNTSGNIGGQPGSPIGTITVTLG